LPPPFLVFTERRCHPFFEKTFYVGTYSNRSTG
jgi:hypothetical protein